MKTTVTNNRTSACSIIALPTPRYLLWASIAAMAISGCGGNADHQMAAAQSGGSTQASLRHRPVKDTPFTVLHNFNPFVGDAISPGNGKLVEAADGNFYGATYFGGLNRAGAVFKVTPDGVETVIHSFPDASTGAAHGPTSGLALDKDGNMVGVAGLGAKNNCGVIYMISTTGTYAELHDFGIAAGDGCTSDTDMTYASDGNFYGMTRYGGTYGKGVVYRLSGTGDYTVLYSFGAHAADAVNPQASRLVEAPDGMLYGTSEYGGDNGDGTLFSITTAGEEAVLYSFGPNDPLGHYPASALALGYDGNLYGTTPEVGMKYGGTIFKYSPRGRVSLVHTFTDGAVPLGAELLPMPNGDLYGVTYFGGTGMGTLYVYSTATNTHTQLLALNAQTGFNPTTGLTLDTDGHMYGLASGGGAYGYGTAFRY